MAIPRLIETQEEGLSLSLIWPSSMNLLLLQARMMRPKQSGGHCQTSWTSQAA